MVLYIEAKRLGYEFSFLTEEFAQGSDTQVHALLAHPHPVELCDHRAGYSDQIADVAGLVALVKGGYDGAFIHQAEAEIRNVGFFRTIPDFFRKQRRRETAK